MDRLALGMTVAMLSACSIDDDLQIDRDAYPLDDGGSIASDGGADLPDAAPDAAPLPRGGISVHYRAAEPEGALAADTTYELTLELYNELTGDVQDEEVFDLSAELGCETWTLDLPDDETVVERRGVATFGVEITPSQDDETCELTVAATSRRNPALGAAPRLEMQLGEAPEVGRALVLRHPVDSSGRLLVRDSALPLDGEPIQLTLVNRADGPADYEVELFVTLPEGASTAGWPLEDDPRTKNVCCVDPGIQHGDIRLLGPADALGQKGTLTLRLTEPDEELSREFVVVEAP